MSESSPRARAALAPEGPSIGDAFGEPNLARVPEIAERVAKRLITTRRPWKWTDDTAMALSIVDTLVAQGAIDEDDLARRFAARYAADPMRGYGAGAHRI